MSVLPDTLPPLELPCRFQVCLLAFHAHPVHSLSAYSDRAASNAIIAAITVTALYFAREVLLPIALAVLLSFVLAPLVKSLQAIRLPRLVAVMVSVFLSFVVVASFAGLMFHQVSMLAQKLPSYQSTLSQKIVSFRGAATASGPLKQASQVLESLRKELDHPDNVTAQSAPASTVRPVPVQVYQPDPGALETISELISPLLHPLATTGIVVIFVVFILIQQSDLRSRFIRLGGTHDLQRTTVAMDDAGRRLSRLFLTQLALNAFFGLVIGVGLWAIGVPSAPLWGLLGAILRFVPYIGAIASAIFPTILATAVEPGWTMTALTVGLFLIVELIVGQVVEPLAYGHSSGLSPVAVIISATFWTWLWGPVGLILATPLTVCLVVAGRHVERLEFIDVLLGDEPVLSPSQVLYQRLLAGDPVEAIDQARAVVRDQWVSHYYDHVFFGALRLAWADMRRGMLESDQVQRIVSTAKGVVDELDADRVPEATSEDERMQAGAGLIVGENVVLLIPGGKLDDAAVAALGQVLVAGGLSVRSEAFGTPPLPADGPSRPALICICYLEAAGEAQLRYTVRRSRRIAPTAKLIIVHLGQSDEVSPELTGDLRSVESLNGNTDSITARIRNIAQANRRSEIYPSDRPAANNLVRASEKFA